MALKQLFWSLDTNKELASADLQSEQELEDLLSEHIELLNPDWMVIGRQIKTRNGKFLDLLCLERDCDLVVVELKSKKTPREVTAQVIEYASYMAELTAEEIADNYLAYTRDYLQKTEKLEDAYKSRFGVDLEQQAFESSMQDKHLKMVIVATEMDSSTEHIITFLRDTYQVDINILFFRVFQSSTERILSRVWFHDDLEETSTSDTPSAHDGNDFYVSLWDDANSTGSHWADACKYGFISAGGGSWYSQTLNKLTINNRVWVYIPQHGYVGVGIVTGNSKPAEQAVITYHGEQKQFSELKQAFQCDYFSNGRETADKAEYIVPVKWLKTVPFSQAVKEVGFFGNQNTVCYPKNSKWTHTLKRLKALWNISDE